MLCRYAARASASALSAARTRAPTTFAVTATPTRLLRLAGPAAAFNNNNNNTHSFNVRHSSSDSDSSSSSSSSTNLPPTLWPPWQPTDLRAAEQEAYARHGADYLSHLTPAARELSLVMARRRRHGEVVWKAQLGEEHWYTILKESNKRFNEDETSFLADIKARRAELGHGPENDDVRHELHKESRARHVGRRDRRRTFLVQVAAEYGIQVEGYDLVGGRRY